MQCMFRSWHGETEGGQHHTSILMDTPDHNDLHRRTKIAQDKPTWTQHLRLAFPGQQC